MKDFVKNLYDNLLEELSLYADLGALPVRKVTGALTRISEAVAKLQDFITITPFETAADEIQFFKYDKPAFICEQFYAMEIFTIETARPQNDVILLKTFYEQELKYISRFLEQNKFLYAYYQNDMQALDHLLFVRGAKPSDIPVPDIIGLDPAFNTCCDNLFAKFMAFDRLQEYLLAELCALEHPSSTANIPVINDKPDTTWTDSKVDLIELGYAIQSRGSVNRGKADVKLIMTALEYAFNINTGNYYAVFQQNIRIRKKSRTVYIDKLKDALDGRMDDSDE
jgi:hypothetical protein